MLGDSLHIRSNNDDDAFSFTSAMRVGVDFNGDFGVFLFFILLLLSDCNRTPLPSRLTSSLKVDLLLDMCQGLVVVLNSKLD